MTPSLDTGCQVGGVTKTPRLPLRYGEMWEMIALELRGVRTRYLPMQSSPSGLFHLSFGTLISRRRMPCASRRLWPYHTMEPPLYVRAPSLIRLIVVLLLSANSTLFFGRWLLIQRAWQGGPVWLRALLRRRKHTKLKSPP